MEAVSGLPDLPDYLPARMLNEYAYCPRLAYLEWVQGEFAHNVFTEDGRFQHRNVDDKDQGLPEPIDEASPRIARSVTLSSTASGLIAKIDLVECSGTMAIPVDYKRGKKPDLPEGAWEPDRVQLCAQGLLLRENGFQCLHGIIYYAGSKDRVEVPFDEPLLKRTREIAADLRLRARSGHIPPPLMNSPKCDGCSLVGICLPDETTILADSTTDEKAAEPRRLIPARDDALPVYVQTQGAYVGKSGDALVIKINGQTADQAKLYETSQLNLLGHVQI
ncbi:MAG: CRISPR-associated protein Cas4, partial [Deltaproteobacteria bacterium]|nr:CRISPR-associated protein Cas4 [Deltaproteobacteria bacterium]